MDRVLLVDDEENVLRGYKRSLHGKFRVDTALSGPLALKLIEENGPYPVIISDMRMPEMTGVELLCEVKQRCPDTVRVLLTGNTDQETAVGAINKGDVFRFLNKPCSSDELGNTISRAIDHHRLIRAEKDLLENTLKGAVEVLVELLSLVRPDVLGQTMRLRHLLRNLAEEGSVPFEIWQLDTACLLSQLGYTTLSPRLVEQAQAGQELLEEEQHKLDQGIALAAGLIEKIPRLESIAEIIRHQDTNYDGHGSSRGGASGETIPLGARILKCVLDYDRCLTRNLSMEEALAFMKRKAHRYDPEVFSALKASLSAEGELQSSMVPVTTLRSSMRLAEDVCTRAGLLVAPKGLEATESVRAHLLRFLESGQIDDRVLVHGS